MPRNATWLVAPDSFKGTFSADEVAAALAAGVRAAGCTADPCPVADGGEGTMVALVGARGGTLHRSLARDPLGRPIKAEFALLADGCTAVVETAEASGLGRVDPTERDAEDATSAGTGDLIVAAARAGAERILVAVGGSACTDGGVGAIEAIQDAGGLEDVRLEVLCDSRTSFERAAIVFGPQKGADPPTVERLTRTLASIARKLPRDPTGVPMTGCAGGLSGGLWAFGAQLRSGADTVLDAVGFEARAAASGQVITGEGRLDSQSVHGKLISAVTRRAGRLGATTHAIVGQADVTNRDLATLGLATVTTASTLDAVCDAAERLARAATRQDVDALSPSAGHR